MRFFLIARFTAVAFALLTSLAIGRAEESISLAGQWRFSRDEAKVGITEKWYAANLKTVGVGPTEIFLPGTTDQAKAGVPNPLPPGIDKLYRPNVYTGMAWYQRDIDIPELWKGAKPKDVTLCLERNHWVTHVWLDDKDLGTRDSLIAPQVYDLGIGVTAGKHRLTICVDNTLKFDLGRFCSINYEGTQTNWNGIVGAITLNARSLVSVDHMEVYPDVDHKLINVKAHILNLTGTAASGQIEFLAADDSGLAVGAPVSATFTASHSETIVRVKIPMGDHPKLWDEFSPNLYVLKASLTADKLDYFSENEVTFGMRKLSEEGTQFLMNGRPLMLRGTVECAIFPLTGYPPTDVASWRRIYEIEKSYGLNFIRFHSWCPPEEAFTAADQEGVMIQVEAPQTSTPAGVNTPRDDFVTQERLRILHAYGNHPSFCLMTLGNEFNGPLPLLTKWIAQLIDIDPRHLYSNASCGRIQPPNREWQETAAGRGIHDPGTLTDANQAVTGQTLPSVGHEIGEWTSYPNFDEIKKYTGVLQAKNFEIIRADLQKKGMGDQAHAFFEATGQQAVLLYKEEIENLLRTRGYGGFSLLSLYDYPGQGTALVGILDAFWDSKGFITPEEFRRFCGPTVPLLRIPKRTYATNETFLAQAEIAHFGPVDLTDAHPEWTLAGENGQVLASGLLPTLSVPTGTLTKLGEISLPLDKIMAPAKLLVTVSLKGTAISNSWNIWVYPPPAAPTEPSGVVISHTWDDATKAALAAGKKVFLFPTLAPTHYITGSFTPVYWSPIWFKPNLKIPMTMGILCDPKNPLFAQFPTDSYSNWQWWNLLKGSQTMLLDSTPANFRPLVQVIDNFARNSKLGNVFEAKVGPGSLLVCTLNLANDKLPEVAQFRTSLLDYAGSASFAPTTELAPEAITKIFSATIPPVSGPTTDAVPVVR